LSGVSFKSSLLSVSELLISVITSLIRITNAGSVRAEATQESPGMSGVVQIIWNTSPYFSRAFSRLYSHVAPKSTLPFATASVSSG